MTNATGIAEGNWAAPHIRLDAGGVAWLGNTNVKVIEIVLDRFAYGWSPEEVQFQYPHLTLAEIHALAWYYDHQSELDAEVEQRLRDVEAHMAQAGESALRNRLRAAGRLR